MMQIPNLYELNKLNQSSISRGSDFGKMPKGPQNINAGN